LLKNLIKPKWALEFTEKRLMSH